jgi:hypothetical protein
MECITLYKNLLENDIEAMGTETHTQKSHTQKKKQQTKKQQKL